MSSVDRVFNALAREGRGAFRGFDSALKALEDQATLLVRTNPDATSNDLAKLIESNPSLEKSLGDAYKIFLKASEEAGVGSVRAESRFVKAIVESLPKKLRDTPEELKAARRLASDMMQTAAGRPPRQAPAVAPDELPVLRDALSPATRAPVRPVTPAPAQVTSRLSESTLNYIDESREILGGADPTKVQEFFKNLRDKVTKDSKGLLVQNLPQPRGQALEPQKVLEELQAGRPVTRAELNAAETHFKGAAEEAAKLATKNFNIKQLGLALSQLRIDMKSNFKVDTVQFFGRFREFADEAGLIKENNQIARIKQLSPKEIFEELTAGRPVTNNEHDDLVSFFKRNFDKKLSAEELEKNRAATPPVMPMGGLAGGAATGGLTRAIPIVTSLIPYITRNLGGEARAVSRNTIWEWENVGTPGFWRSYGNNLADGRRGAWAGTTALALTTAIGSTFGYVHYNPEGNTTGFLHNAIYDAVFWEDKPFDGQPNVYNRLYDLLYRNGQPSREMFAEYAEALTGIKLDASKAEFDREKLREIAVFMSNKPLGRAGSGKTEYDVTGFQYALAGYSSVDAQIVTDMRTKGGTEVDGKKMSVWEYLAHANSNASVSSTYDRLIGEDGNTKAFIDTAIRLSGSDILNSGRKITEYEGPGKSIPPMDLLHIAINAQSASSSGNPREQTAFFAALIKKIDPGFNPNFAADADKKGDGKDNKDFRDIAIEKAFDLVTRTLRNTSQVEAFTKTALGRDSLPANNEERQVLVLESLKDYSFASSPKGTILSLLYLGKRTSEISRDADDWVAHVTNRITQIKSSSASQQQTEYAAGAQTALDQYAGRAGQEALANQRAQEQAEARQAQKIKEIRDSFGALAAAVPGLQGKAKDMQEAFDAANLSGAFNRAVTGHDPYKKFAEELASRGIPRDNIPVLVEHVRGFQVQPR